MTPIKEQLIVKVAEWLQATAGKGFNYPYNFQRAIDRFDPETMPMISLFQRPVDNPVVSYRNFNFDLDLRIQATNPVTDMADADTTAVNMETDLLEAFFARRYEMNYTGGHAGNETVPIGKIVTPSWGSFVIESLTVATGDWEMGNAAGKMIIKRLVGTYAVQPVTFDGGGFTMNLPAITEKDNLTLIFGSDLKVQELIYVASGIDSYPESDGTAIASSMDIKIRYKTETGNFYRQ